jgi:hypothetical protein
VPDGVCDEVDGNTELIVGIVAATVMIGRMRAH